MPSKSRVEGGNKILQGILLANLCLHVYRVNAETKISPKEVTINNGAQQCFTCTTTQQEAHWLVNGVYKRGNATPNGDLRVDRFCSTFPSNATVTCFGESSTPSSDSISENDSAQVIVINEVPTASPAIVSTEPGISVSTGLPTGPAGTMNTNQPTFIPPFIPPDGTAITVPVILIVIAVVLIAVFGILLWCRHNEEREKEKENVALPSAVDPTSEPSTSPNPLQNLLLDEEKENEDVALSSADDPTPPLDDLHLSSKPEPLPFAQHAPLDLVKEDREPSKTGWDSPNDNDVPADSSPEPISPKSPLHPQHFFPHLDKEPGRASPTENVSCSDPTQFTQTYR